MDKPDFLVSLKEQGEERVVLLKSEDGLQTDIVSRGRVISGWRTSRGKGSFSGRPGPGNNGNMSTCRGTGASGRKRRLDCCPNSTFLLHGCSSPRPLLPGRLDPLGAPFPFPSSLPRTLPCRCCAHPGPSSRPLSGINVIAACCARNPGALAPTREDSRRISLSILTS